MIKGIYQTLHRKLKIAQHEPKTGDELICSGNLNRSLVLQNIKLGIGNTRPHTGKNPSHHTWLWCYSQSRLVIYRSPGSVLRTQTTGATESTTEPSTATSQSTVTSTEGTTATATTGTTGTTVTQTTQTTRETESTTEPTTATSQSTVTSTAETTATETTPNFFLYDPAINIHIISYLLTKKKKRKGKIFFVLFVWFCY